MNQAVAIAAMCLQEEASVRPLIADIAPALGFLATASPEVILTPPIPLPSPSSRKEMSSKHESDNEEEEAGSEYTDEDGSEYTDEEGSEEYDDNEDQGSQTSGSKRRTDSVARGRGLSSPKNSRKSSRNISDGEHDSSNGIVSATSSRKSSCRRSVLLQDGQVSVLDQHAAGSCWKPEDRRSSSSHKQLLQGSHSSRQRSRRSGGSEDRSGSRKLSNKVVSHNSSRGAEGHVYASISHRSSPRSCHGSQRSSSEAGSE